MIIYTDFIPKRFAGYTIGPVILIRPKYKNDIGLREHEKIHVSQWLRTFGVHSFLYLLSKKYRFKSEVEAYKEQLIYCPNCIDRFSMHLVNLYKLKITKEQAREALNGIEQ